ncbi:unnamed protein product [Bathycoccus prasinos]
MKTERKLLKVPLGFRSKSQARICLDYDIYDPNCKEKQKYTLEYFKKAGTFVETDVRQKRGSYCGLNGNILKLTNMPDTLYDMVEENANFAIWERTETKPMHQNIETQGIPGDINTELQHLGFSGIYWTTSYGFKCDQNSEESFVWKMSHFSNNFCVTKHEPTGDWYVANFSRECRSTKFIQGTKINFQALLLYYNTR